MSNALHLDEIPGNLAAEVARASTEQAAALQAAGMTPADGRAEFATFYAEVIDGLPG